jgi:hypothetical protein
MGNISQAAWAFEERNVSDFRCKSNFATALLCLAIVSATFQKTFWYIGGLRVLLSDVLMICFSCYYVAVLFLRSKHPARFPGVRFLGASAPWLFAILLSGLVNAMLRLDVGLFLKGAVVASFEILFQALAIQFIFETESRKQFYFPLSFVVGAFISVLYSAAQWYYIVAKGVNLDDEVLARVFSPVWHVGIQEIDSLYRVSGLMADPNHFGILIVISFAIALSFLLHRSSDSRKRLKLVLVCVSLSFFLALVFSFSRSAAVAFVVMLGIFVSLARRWQPLLYTGGIKVVIICVSLGVAALIYFQHDDLLDIAKFKLNPDTEGMQMRADLVEGGISIWYSDSASLIFGIGSNGFSSAYERRFGIGGWNAHNSWLTELVENGVAGLLAYSLLVGYVFRKSYLSFRNGAFYPLLNLAYMAAFAGVLVGGMFYDIFRWNYVLVLQALTVGLAEHSLA